MFQINVDIVSMCEDLELKRTGQDGRSDLRQEVAISLLTAEGYDGENCCVSVQACLALRETLVT